MEIFTRINNRLMIGELKLKGYELLLYAILHGMSKEGKEWVKKPIKWYAEEVLYTNKTRVSETISSLKKRGLIEEQKSGRERWLRVTENVTESYGKRNNTVTENVTNSYGKRNQIVTESVTDTLYNDIKNDRGKKRAPACEEEKNSSIKNSPVEQPNPLPPSPPPPDDYADTNTAWAEHYKAATGTDYQPIFQYHTDDMRWLAHAIRAKAANFGVQPTDSIADFARSLFDHFRSIADKWQLSRWTTHTITNQFNELFEKTISSNGKQNNGTDNCRISRDYLERTMREAGLM